MALLAALIAVPAYANCQAEFDSRVASFDEEGADYRRQQRADAIAQNPKYEHFVVTSEFSFLAAWFLQTDAATVAPEEFSRTARHVLILDDYRIFTDKMDRTGLSLEEREVVAEFYDLYTDEVLAALRAKAEAHL
ncbi:MAG: hypothetical protein AAF408_02005 [Pseudomonadota bacterium]